MPTGRLNARQSAEQKRVRESTTFSARVGARARSTSVWIMRHSPLRWIWRDSQSQSPPRFQNWDRERRRDDSMGRRHERSRILPDMFPAVAAVVGAWLLRLPLEGELRRFF